MKAQAIADALRAGHLGLPRVVASAYGATVRAQIGILPVLNTQVKTWRGVFWPAPGR